MNWQEKLTSQMALTEPVHYIVNDPDNLCFEPAIADLIELAGAVLFSDTDPLALRLCFEEWLDSDECNALLIRVVDEQPSIPYDIESSAKRVDFDISEVLTELDASVLRSLSPKDYEQLQSAVKSYGAHKLNRNASLDFVLRHIYKIAPEIIQSETDLVRLLIRKHYLGIEMPLVFEVRLIETLQVREQFSRWDFSRIVPDRTEFFALLQQQWSLHLQRKAQRYEIMESSWPVDELVVPFDDQDIKVFVDNLFADGILQAVDFDGLGKDDWEWVGVIADDESRDLLRVRQILKKLSRQFIEQDSPLPEASEQWEETARELGVLNLLSQSLRGQDSYSLNAELINLNSKVDAYFETWLQANFSKLINTPTVRFPKMLHKIPDWLNLKVNKRQKVCLLVMDGMGFQQWNHVKEHIVDIPHVRIEERGVFSWVPTITSIARQALFSGKEPRSFPDSLLTTSKEKALWHAFWEDQGLSKSEVTYAVKIEHSKDLESFKDRFHSPKLKVAGFVINYIDEQMHGIKAGMAPLNAAVDIWLDQWQFSSKIEALLDSGFEVVITADHGNQEAIGQSWPNEGVKAETKGERVRLYKNTVECSNDTVDVLEWPAKKFGLPSDLYPLVSRGRHAFVQKGKQIVGHGGISLHEVVVPLAIVTREQHVQESQL
ncbi:BREX-3 system phosphatase PglZ [Vibrio crassostreae]|uniref:BREX-3 system phosphatase PglZ n=1 Tax=Vibrio crassostreae TaxID=246167 RepID=UPI000F491D07|nr:BREX-3 system phosphatase PglZ [Vibrio crassostreae]ROS70660.1 PglZ domain-containing protein [Vibrio crassostreae]TCN99113.1 PglZ domain-containing protein [Vibrio crassostreae]CAK3386501.1 PglZ domain-containing protein [Vibrio crassostreae]